MISESALRNALQKSLHWFKHSSIMVPENGTWGIAERIFNAPDPELRKKVFDSFNSFTDYESWSVIESRRPDCNFETAYLFLLAAELGMDAEAREIAHNLLEYLYNRSGLLNRGVSTKEPLGVWNWSHTQWRAALWLDDNSWTLAIPLLILHQAPDEAEKFDMLSWAKLLAGELSAGFERSFHAVGEKPVTDIGDPQGVWFGRPGLPHWGALVCFALAIALREGIGREKDKDLIREYFTYVRDSLDTFNPSELAYALIGCSASARILREKLYSDLCITIMDRILEKMDPVTGSVPSEHYEAPSGAHLVDTIYTINWLLLGFQNCLAGKIGEEKHRQAYEKIFSLVLRIQDQSEERPYNGCWRGMFDLDSGTWGGGNSYEGGAGSIYSGWTNAPIAIVIANELLGKSILG